MTVYDTARAFVNTMHPEATASILGGSAASGRLTSTSDLDIAVLYADGHANYAETTTFRGWLVEAFVHTPSSLRYWYKREGDARHPVIADLCAHGALLTDVDGRGLEWQRDARDRMRRGPLPLSANERELRRYGLSALVDDLSGSEDSAEIFMLSADVFREAADLLMLTRDHWLGGGKWIVRRLRLCEDDLADRLAVWASNTGRTRDDLTLLAREVLDEAGGYLQDGFVRGTRA
ncbi:nucleotidyltransferase domain-containing protein [Cryobacterium roopkundense]|uniref:Polymerase nucleotidyl transferase domain-containing protein n=1 Tax=Cryobacterium roopkundense TaxID=1001240 RepID=A0A7W8ZW28_9MICO|nr:nucleotidyltransferase domain-containing protein [Cryobacterium roopkundense]MBB5641231.1 hypothetical protein [Cryobacterium roopkundense]